MSTEDMMRERLAVLKPTELTVIDDSALHAGHAGARSGGGHYRLTIMSPRFSGCNTMQKHRLVYDALGPLMKREIHALSISALAPESS
ncbi:MAG TPA: BolA family protein [Rugosibacter sp.]